MTFLAFLGFINVYSMRVGLSVAMVAMVNSTSSSPSSFHSHTGNSSLIKSLLQHPSGEDAWILSSGDALGPDTNGTCPSPPGWGNSTSDKVRPYSVTFLWLYHGQNRAEIVLFIIHGKEKQKIILFLY